MLEARRGQNPAIWSYFGPGAIKYGLKNAMFLLEVGRARAPNCLKENGAFPFYKAKKL